MISPASARRLLDVDMAARLADVRDAAALADAAVRWCVDQLEQIERRYAPGFVLPRTLGLHPVGADVTADLLFTLGYLAEAGACAVAGLAPDLVIGRLLATVDGAGTHSFYSYRVAETLLRAGPFRENPLLQGCDDLARAEVALACDSSAWFATRRELPRNYAAVQARCELARVRLGLADDTGALHGCVARLRDLLTENPLSHLDDSGDRCGRFDIYSADVWLFCEPLADHLGPCWQAGARAALSLVDAIGTSGGVAVPWGRSTGVLAAALTLELAALVLGAPALAQGRAAAWLRRGFDALAAVRACYAEGLVTAHQRRNQDGYRGPARRLQLTLDVLGKVAWAAARLRAAQVDEEAAGGAETYRQHDELRVLRPDGRAAVWSYRRGAVAFALPFVGPVRSHYLPAPQAPGCYEVPVDADLPCWTPLVLDRAGRWTAGGLPVSIEHQPETVSARWEGLPATTGTAVRSGRRRACFRVQGRSLVLEDELELDEVPWAISLALPELPRRPLRVEVLSSSGHHLSTLDVSGIAEWRSPWSELARLHQIELQPGRRVHLRLRVTPLLRVTSSAPRHPYTALLQGSLADRVVDTGLLGDRAGLLRESDLFHLHWPEGLLPDLLAHRQLIAQLQRAQIPIVWTAHNLIPHRKRPDLDRAIYQAWAAAASAVIHHSRWGEQKMRACYRFAPGCRHRVIPHGHFAARFPSAAVTRDEAAARLGLPPAQLRIGLVGSPRVEKRVGEFLQGAAACRRDDLQVVCWSLPPGALAPVSPRIAVAEPYGEVDAHTYGLRLAACDALALPVDPEGDMLGSGVAADAVGAGLAVFGSDWGYLSETLAGARIPCGHSAESVRRALDALEPSRLAEARRCSVALRPQLDWIRLAATTADLFEEVVMMPGKM